MKTIYWTTTSLLSLMLLASAYTYIFHKGTIEGVRDLGFPDYFRVQLAVLKCLGVCVLLAPNLPLFMKEWAYAGVGLFLITAIVAHLAHKDPIGLTVLNVAFFALLVLSHRSLYKLTGG